MSATAPSPPDQAQRRSRPAALLALMRPRHWAKNAFVLAPLFFSEEFKVAASVLDAAGAFAIFCLCSSAVYALNDYRDRAEDRLRWNPSWRVPDSVEIDAEGFMCVWYQDGDDTAAPATASAQKLALQD